LERSARLIILSSPDYNWPGDNLKLRLFLDEALDHNRKAED
jgi:hypothetical protein